MLDKNARNLWSALLISLLVFAALSVVRATGGLQAFELLAYDLLTVIGTEARVSDDVTIVSLNEEDIHALGGWPVSDEKLATLLAKLQSHNPSAIGIDIYRDVPVPPGTAELEHALSAGNVYAIYKFDTAGSPGVAAPEVLAATERTGFSDFVLDPTRVVRRGLAFLDDGERFGYAFALRLALAHLAREGHYLQSVGESGNFALGRTEFVPLESDHGGYVDADTHGYQFLIDYDKTAFDTVSMQAVLNGEVNADVMQGRLILIGVDAISVQDAFATPTNPFARAADTGMPGVVLHAVIVDQLIRAARLGHRPMGALDDWVEYLTMLIACLIAGCLVVMRPNLVLLGVVSMFGVVVIAACGIFLANRAVWLPVVPLALAWLITLAVTVTYMLQREYRDRELLKRMFAASASAEMAEALWERREEFIVDGQYKPNSLSATVVFVDLGGFTRISESLRPDVLIDWINDFMALATDTIIEYGGVVDDYFGDGIKANFGVPFARVDVLELRADARAAATCMLALESRVASLNERTAAKGRPSYLLRAGICSGPVVLGGLGTRARQKYTSMGDPVNVAARLEGLGKEIGIRQGVSVMLSEGTVELLEQEFDLHRHGSVELKGRSAPVEVYELLGFRKRFEVVNIEKQDS